MAHKEFHYRWEWDFQASPRALWPFVADTNRFNYDAGVPKVKQISGEQQPGSGKTMRMKAAGMTWEWKEAPFEWVAPHRFGVVRSYRKGPLAEIRVQAELTERPGGGSHLVYQIWAKAAGWLGRILIPISIGRVSAKKFDETLRNYDRLATMKTTAPALPVDDVELAPGGTQRMATLRKQLASQGAPPESLAKIADLVEKGDEITAAKMRPYALADAWGVPRRNVLETCLLATRAGMLDFRWDVLCPLCRGSRGGSDSLGGVSSKVHCDSCNIDFSANFDRSVEVSFRPNAAIRPIEAAEFCVGGPMVTPHIQVQQIVPAGSERPLAVALDPGRYRIRTLRLQGSQAVAVAAEAPAEVVLRADAKGWSTEEARVAPGATLRFRNDTSDEQLFILERTAWSDQAATAAEVTGMQVFRDLFSKEALRPGEQISVGALTILFTDLRGSTRMYREIGDAPAFGLVMDHFDILKKAIAAENGAIVKTIGDAVMGCFQRPSSALKAILEAQKSLAAVKAGGQPLLLKAGIHCGPCIAVTLNERLDYFGSTVNIASRLEGLCTGGDVVVTDAVKTDPEVAEFLAAAKDTLTSQPIHAALKGFDDVHFELTRIALTPLADKPLVSPQRTQKF